MEVLFRAFQRQDMDALFFLEQRCYPEPYRFRFGQLLNTLLDKNVVSLVAEVVEDPPPGHTGLAAGLIVRLEPEQKRLVVLTLMVTEALRRQGLGRRLLEKSIALGRKSGHEALVVPVEKGNEEASLFLMACGLESHNELTPFFTRPEEGAVWRMGLENVDAQGT